MPSGEPSLSVLEREEAAAAEAEARAAAARDRAARLRRQVEAIQAAAVENGETTDVGIPRADESVVKARRLRRPKLATAAGGLAVLVTCALLTASGYMIWHHKQAMVEQQRAAEYAASARQAVVTLMSLDFTKAQDDVQRVIDNSTGQFKDDFQSTAADFIKAAQDSKVVTEVTVQSAAVESMTNDSAVVLVAATSKVTNSAGAKQEPRSWRLSVNVTRDGGQIKLSKVEFVP